MHVYIYMQVRAAADLEMQQVVNEVRRQVEKEKEIAIAETKRKKWVRFRHTPCPRKYEILQDWGGVHSTV